MNAWLGLIGALAGTAIGGFVTYMVANQRHSFERATEKERRLITACESIHSESIGSVSIDFLCGSIDTDPIDPY